jgi:hypothetical protein
MQGSSTLIAAQMAADMRADGIDVIDLSVGEPDFDTPEFIRRYAWEGLEKGLTKYTSTAGLAGFRNSICDSTKLGLMRTSSRTRSPQAAAASRHCSTQRARCSMKAMTCSSLSRTG